MIKTNRLLMRRARLDDLEDLHQVFSNAEAMRYWDSLPYDDIDRTGHLLTAMIRATPGESDDFVVEHQGRVIGKAGAWCQKEIGFIFHPDYWGKGLAREALGAVIPHIFQTLPIDHLDADVDPRNHASLRLLRRLGFVETGRAERTIEVGGVWCDSVYLRLVRPEQQGNPM